MTARRKLGGGLGGWSPPFSLAEPQGCEEGQPHLLCEVTWSRWETALGKWRSGYPQAIVTPCLLPVKSCTHVSINQPLLLPPTSGVAQQCETRSLLGLSQVPFSWPPKHHAPSVFCAAPTGCPASPGAHITQLSCLALPIPLRSIQNCSPSI